MDFLSGMKTTLWVTRRIALSSDAPTLVCMLQPNIPTLQWLRYVPFTGPSPIPAGPTVFWTPSA